LRVQRGTKRSLAITTTFAATLSRQPFQRPENAMSTSRDAIPRIDVSPDDGLTDQPLSIGLRGFEPNQLVTLRAAVRPAKGEASWASHATFRADDTGAVDLSTQAPIAGSYAEADATGLIWSLTLGHGSGGGRFIAEGLNPYTFELTAEVDGEIAATASALRRAVDPSVTVLPVRENGIVANLFLPPGAGPFPTIVVLGGSGGGFPDGFAALFASHGYAAFSLAYFGAEELPPELLNIPLEYFETALEWVRRRPDLDTEHLAVYGGSRGGELALLLASRYPVLKTVVAYVPSGYSWGAVSRDDDTSPDGFPSWTYGGRAIPYVARVRNDAVAPNADGTLTLTPAFLRYLEDEERATAAAIPVERINGPILLVSGRDDALWPSAVFGDLIVERLEQQRFAHPYQHLSYEGAGHTIGAPYGPATVLSGFHPVRQVTINYGGTPSAIAHARHDSWPKVLQFLDVHVKSRVLAVAGAARS
jgi:dienelactone hydrolase